VLGKKELKNFRKEIKPFNLLIRGSKAMKTLHILNTEIYHSMLDFHNGIKVFLPSFQTNWSELTKAFLSFTKNFKEGLLAYDIDLFGFFWEIIELFTWLLCVCFVKFISYLLRRWIENLMLIAQNFLKLIIIMELYYMKIRIKQSLFWKKFEFSRAFL